MSAIEIKKQYRGYLINKLAKHFQVDKDVLRKEIDIENDNILQFESLADKGFSELIFSAHISNANHDEFFFGKKFLKSAVYAMFTQAEETVNPKFLSKFIMSLHKVGTHYIVYRDPKHRGYDGLGGIYLTLPSDERFVIEPVENFLNYYYPQESLSGEE